MPPGRAASKPSESAPKPAPKAAAHAGNAAAAQLKEEGNALYKKREFDAALAKYDEAFSLEPENTTFLLNRTAVFFEMGSFEKCIEEVDRALAHGKEHKADYVVMVKLMTRKGACLQKLRKYDEAIALFKDALLEHRNPDTLAKLNSCEREKKERRRRRRTSTQKSPLRRKKKGINSLRRTNSPTPCAATKKRSSATQRTTPSTATTRPHC